MYEVEDVSSRKDQRLVSFLRFCSNIRMNQSSRIRIILEIVTFN